MSETLRDAVLSVRNLQVEFRTPDGTVRAVRGIDFDLMRGEILGIVGETGSGKSVACKAVLRLLPPSSRQSGTVMYDGVDLAAVRKRDMIRYRGKAISMIFQDPISCLNPIRTIYRHMREVLVRDGERKNLRSRATDRLERLHIVDAGARLNNYPFQFSGGMAQRVQIAMALSGSPGILIADEPTTALDVTIQASILDELKSIAATSKLAVILVTHDLAVVSETCNRMAVMYHGCLVEIGSVEGVLKNPRHPYTRALLGSVPELNAARSRFTPIKGECLPADKEVAGCDFAERCPRADSRCATNKPESIDLGGRSVACFHPFAEGDSAIAVTDQETAPRTIGERAIVSVRDLCCTFYSRDDKGIKIPIKAVDRVSFDIRSREIFGVVGESGSGKSTLAKASMGITEVSSGSIVFDNKRLHGKDWDFKSHTARVQYVFQDTLGALDPRMDILNQVMEVLAIHNPRLRDREARSESILIQCGLDSSLFHRRPYSLSGGQRQRAVIARSLVNEPEFLICDEPVSAMDVSVQAQVLNLIKELSDAKGLTVMFISHNMGIVNNLCDRVAVMFAGQIVEIGDMKSIFFDSRHPYTKQLLESMPKTGNSALIRRSSVLPKGESAKIHNGCSFASRCAFVKPECVASKPILTKIGADHEVACYNI